MMFISGGEQFSATAKARVRKGTLLDGDTIRHLLDCVRVSDIAHMLKSTYYASFLPSDAENLHRDKLEFLLTNIIDTEVQSFFSSAGLERHAFLKIWFERQDIIIMKNRIREIYAGKFDSAAGSRDYEDLAPLNFPLFNKQRLFSATRIDEVISSIRNEKLAAYIEDAMKRSVGGTAPGLMMAFAIDVFQNDRLYEAACCFSGEEKAGLLSLIGMEMDIMNITSIYRGKKYFKMSDETALTTVLSSRYRVSFDMLKAMAQLPPERMWELLAGTRYASLLPIEGASSEISKAAGITRMMRSIERANAVRVFHSGGSGIHFVLAYLILRELEILDLSAIIEIVRYNYDRRKAEKLLAYPLAEGW